jgi:hypothetical protein
LSIDIGLYHLGLSLTEVTDEYEFEAILHVEMVDITRCKHRKTCTLEHSCTIADQVRHLVEEFKEMLDQVDEILLERQPPQGLVAIEQLLFYLYREKAILVHPRKIHNYIGSGSFDYDQRKVISQRAAEIYLTDQVKEIYNYYERKHDIADSICMMLWWINKQRQVCAIKKKVEASGLEQFRYINSNPIMDD